METIKRHKVDYGNAAHFPEFSTTPRRCLGRGCYLCDGRGALYMHLAFLARDKRASADPNAVAVVWNDFRNVGYLSEWQATSSRIS
ncbi:hypothetical protein PV761_10920 [Arthrobacter sp. CC3]|uniref:hypothetical protein n=1 Tax=Arthrobacter sp. CC3 TaxID=3029185 RepID=UPI003267BA0A